MVAVEAAGHTASESEAEALLPSSLSPLLCSALPMGCLLFSTSMKTPSDMPRSASHMIPNPVRLTNKLRITGPGPGWSRDPLEVLRGCKSQCLQSKGAGWRDWASMLSSLPGCPSMCGAIREGRHFDRQDKALLKWSSSFTP